LRGSCSEAMSKRTYLTDLHLLQRVCSSVGAILKAKEADLSFWRTSTRRGTQQYVLRGLDFFSNTIKSDETNVVGSGGVPVAARAERSMARTNKLK
jgi:hypothetical protein